MILETKFNLGETVWTIGMFNWPSKNYMVGGPLTIGQVRKEVTFSPGIEGKSMFSNYAPQSGDEEQYMCVETGIGSGTLHNADKLFRTKEEAETEASRLNV
jgi:hypothetical protein